MAEKRKKIPKRETPGRKKSTGKRKILRSSRFENMCRSLFEQMLNGVAYCQMLFDDDANPVDFKYLAVNDAFGTLTGLKDVVGRKVTEVIPGIRESDPEILERYGRVSKTGEPERFEIFARSLGVWFSISVYCPERGYFVAVFDVITGRKRSEEALKESLVRLELAHSAAGAGTWDWDLKSGRLEWSKELCAMFGVDPELTRASFETWRKVVHPEDIKEAESRIEAAVKKGTLLVNEYRVVLPSGAIRWINALGSVVYGAQNNPLRMAGLCLDITSRKLNEEIRIANLEVMRLCSQAGDLPELIRSLTGYLHEFVGCQAVGVRLKEGEDFPYYETRGFPEEFIILENSLCARDQKGEPVRASNGNPVIECMCGNVLFGRFDPSKPFFTPGGSFWTNCTTELLAGTTEADRQGRTRNRCNGEGYESVALIPLGWAGRTFGLIQFNDKRKGRFTYERIKFIEDIARIIAATIAKMEAEKELRESEELWRALVENTLVGVGISDGNEVLFANRELLTYFGYEDSSEEFYRIPLIDHVAPESRDLVADRMARIRNGETIPAEFEYHIRRRDGTTRLLRAMTTGIVWKGRPSRETVFVDITESRNLEEERRKSEEGFRLLFDNSINAVAIHEIVLDDKGGPVDYIFLQANSAFERQTGLKVSDIIGKRVTEIIPGIDRTDLIQKYGAVALTGESVLFESYFEPLQRHFNIEAYQVGKGRFAVVFEDIIERKRAESVLKKARGDAEAASKAKSEFLTNIAHDFRTPVHIIQGFGRELLSSELSGEQKEWAKVIDKNATALIDMIEELLDVSRLDSGKIKLRKVEFDINKCVADAVETARVELHGKEVAMIYSIDDGIPLLKGDVTRLNQIMMNIIGNAVKYTDKGEISVSVKRDRGNEPEGKCRVKISVKDTGLGIPADKLPRIYDAFARFHEFEGGKARKGEGLGLYITKTLVDMMGGAIEVMSEVGVGSEFVVGMDLDVA